MNTTVLLFAVTLALFSVLVHLWVRAWFRAAGERVVTCPESHQAAGITLAAARAATGAVLGGSEPVIRSCSRWPEKGGCGQECLAEIHAAADGCLVREKVRAWYEGKSCVRCSRDLSPACWQHNRPALRVPDGHTRTWASLRPEEVPAALATDEPICWDCHVLVDFVQRFPGRAVLRDKRGHDAAYDS